MKHKKRPDLVILFLLLAVACLGLAVPVALLDPRWLALPALLVAAAAAVLVFHVHRLRRFVAANLGGRSFESSRMQVSLAALPVAAVDSAAGSAVGSAVGSAMPCCAM